jgi:hypothetical protein
VPRWKICQSRSSIITCPFSISTGLRRAKNYALPLVTRKLGTRIPALRPAIGRKGYATTPTAATFLVEH